jgi:hypothetical protein
MSQTEVVAFLAMSPLHVRSLVDRGVLPYRSSSSGRHVPTALVLAFEARREEGRQWLAETFASCEVERQALIVELAVTD